MLVRNGSLMNPQSEKKKNQYVWISFKNTPFNAVYPGVLFLWVNTCCSQTSAENIETQDEERNSTGLGLQTSYSTHRPMGPPRPPLHPFFASAKSEVLRREQQKRAQSFKMEELPGPLITDQQNFSLETKQEPEYVSTTTDILLSSEHTGGMFFPSSSVFWCFSPPAGDEMFWVAVLTVGRHREQ